jgi:hypothetical protein
MQRVIPLAVVLFLLAPPASAERGRGGEDRDRSKGQGISAAQAGEMARRQTGGRVLAVSPRDGGYRVKVLTPQGEVRYVIIPGR